MRELAPCLGDGASAPLRPALPGGGQVVRIGLGWRRSLPESAELRREALGEGAARERRVARRGLRSEVALRVDSDHRIAGRASMGASAPGEQNGSPREVAPDGGGLRA
eukprot:4816303-Alexandrium_andersonii.AAC.1